MPLIYVNSPVGTFSDSARDALAEELTVIALESEKLPMAPFDKSTTWIDFHDMVGGVPLIVRGRLVGAVGVSSGADAEDRMVAEAARDALLEALAAQQG
ncbi:heme-binding protein [Dactylosporangium sp. CA-092794]|uniref:heme-binding protein n=1 Tax=Dactylosporangium sp. CA-092794 TaxID=3239929 RepID=UPI003D8FA6F7